MIDELLAMLGVAGDVIDTPGRFTRTALSGRNPFPTIFDPSQGASGRDMLESWGMLDANQEGLDFGDAAGFGAEMLFDPLNALGGAGLLKGLKGIRGARAANAASDSLRAAGAFPEELGHLGRMVYRGDQGALPSGGLLRRSSLDDMLTDFGHQAPFSRDTPLQYVTESRDVASTYANRDQSMLEQFRQLHGSKGDDIYSGLTGGPPRPPGTITTQILAPRNPLDITHLGESADEFGITDAFRSVDPAFNSTDFKAHHLYDEEQNPFPVWQIFKNSIDRPTEGTNLARWLGERGVDAVRYAEDGTQHWAVVDPSALYSNTTAPAYKDVPSISRLLGALGGYNAAMLPERGQ